jgi:aryl-alcohol dehydrogenase-like predicted oxidoreductase
MNFGHRTAEDESLRILDRALERGVTWLDTANIYNEGRSETIVGKAIASDRDRCLLATKVGLVRIDGRPEGLAPGRVLRAIEESLDRLKTSYVDLYYLHAPDHRTPIAETLDAIAELLRTGKIRAWGMSNFASWAVLDAMNLAQARGMPGPIVAQQIYNAMVRQLDIEWFGFAKAHPIHTTIYNPLAGGLLTGKHTRDQGPPPGTRFDANSYYQRRYWTPRMFDFVAAIGAVAKDDGMTITDLAYAWAARRAGVDSVILGPATVEQLEVGIAACERTVSEEAQKKLDELHRAFQGTDATYAR